LGFACGRGCLPAADHLTTGCSGRRCAPPLNRSVRRTSGGGIAKAEKYEYDNTYGIEYEKWGTLWTGSI
jgi:hypothetical protein